MGDEPSAEALLLAMAAALADQVVPATSGGAAHAARVVANLCRILAREVAAPGDDVTVDLRVLLSADGAEDTERLEGVDTGGLLVALDDRLRDGDAGFAMAALPIVRRDVERRLAISKPSYLDDRS